MGWISPTSHDDPESGWTYETRAYDENTGNYASGNINKYLVLYHAALNCDKVQVWFPWAVNGVVIDIYYESDWHNIWSGDSGGGGWEERSIPAGTKSVTAVRIKVTAAPSYGVSEVDFWEVEISAPTVTTQAVDDIGTTTATGNGNITATGGENCDKRGIVYGTSSQGDPGNVAPGASGYDDYEEETDSFGTGAFTRSLTGLTPAQLYYARAYAHNSAGYSYGAEVEFTTLTAFIPTVAIF